jgi:hypothetical protein
MYINSRPVDFPAALKMFNKHLRAFFGDILVKNKILFFFFDLITFKEESLYLDEY